MLKYYCANCRCFIFENEERREKNVEKEEEEERGTEGAGDRAKNHKIKSACSILMHKF